MEGKAWRGPGAAGAPLLMQHVVIRQRLQVDGTDWFLEPLRNISPFGNESEKRLEEHAHATCCKTFVPSVRLSVTPTVKAYQHGGEGGGICCWILPSIKMLEGKQLTPPSQKKTATKMQISTPSCQNVERRKERKREKKTSEFQQLNLRWHMIL